MSSRTLYQQRAELTKALKIAPYSEIMYTFPTTTGKTLSLEQLYASKYSVSVAQALLNMWQLERNEYIFEIVDKLRAELNKISDNSASEPPTEKGSNRRVSNNRDATAQAIHAMAVAQAAHTNNSTHGGGNNPNENTTLSRIEHLLSAINTIEDFQQLSLETTALVLENCNKMESGKDLVANVLDASVGGACLRRSAWKKYTAWQYCATNLNFHLLTTKHFTFAECLVPGGAGATDTGMDEDHTTPGIDLRNFLFFVSFLLSFLCMFVHSKGHIVRVCCAMIQKLPLTDMILTSLFN